MEKTQIKWQQLRKILPRCMIIALKTFLHPQVANKHELDRTGS